jgi:tetratricopeptide (TPR) repeat protein
MKQRLIARVIICTTAALVSSIVSGCALTNGGSDTKPPVDPNRTAEVFVEDPDFGETIIQVVIDDGDYEEPIGYLRTKDFAEATQMLAELAEAERNEETRASVFFAKGVAHEALGQYEQALEAHKKALRLENNLDYEEGIRRAEQSLGIRR